MKRYLASLSILALVLTAASGCATMGKKNPEAQVRETLAVWQEALVAKNLDQLMTVYSENFRSAEDGTKAQLREFLQGAIDAGYLDSAVVNLDTTVVTVEGDKAVATPIGLSGPMGGMTLKLEFAHEGDAWLIVYSSEA